MAKAQTLADSDRRTSRTTRVAKASIHDRALLLSVLNRELETVCPRFPEMMSNIRRFVSSELSFEKMTVLGVVSAGGGEGSSTVARAMATALAEIYDRTLLVETEPDDRKSLGKDLNQSTTPGLKAYLHHEASLEDIIMPCAKDGLWVLPAGHADSDVSPLESISTFRLLLSLLRPQYDITIVDMPPLLASEEVPALLTYLDGIVIVAESGKTTEERLGGVLAHCDTVPIKGVVLNKQRSSIPRWLRSLVGG